MRAADGRALHDLRAVFWLRINAPLRILSTPGPRAARQRSVVGSPYATGGSDDTAMGHGGQVIALSDELDMVIVVIGDPFWLEDGWKYGKQLKNLVSDFIVSLPSEWQAARVRV
jgi:hypothetical protein